MTKKDRVLYYGWLSLMVIGASGELILCMEAIIGHKFLTGAIVFVILVAILWLIWWILGMSMKLWEQDDFWAIRKTLK